MSTILGIETSTDACSCALYSSAGLIERFEIAPRQQSALILGMIEALLSDAGLSLGAIDAIAFGCGPGSFMGTRLASSVAMGLAFSADLPVCSVSSLRALAQSAYVELGATHVAAAWDARMGEIYYGSYTLQGGVMQSVVADQISSPKAVTLNVDGDTWTLVGNAWEVYRTELPVAYQGTSHLLYPRAGMVAMLAASDPVMNAGALNYLRQGVTPKAYKTPI